MAVDPRQVLAAFLTVTMFVMLGNMIKKDHFDDPVEVRPLSAWQALDLCLLCVCVCVWVLIPWWLVNFLDVNEIFWESGLWVNLQFMESLSFDMAVL